MNVSLNSLPQTLPRENAVKLELEQGVIIFRASSTVQVRIEELLEKEKTVSLSSEEIQELNAYEEIDDYLSHVNRLIRNSDEFGEVNLAA
jgi:hypothetical protein